MATAPVQVNAVRACRRSAGAAASRQFLRQRYVELARERRQAVVVIDAHALEGERTARRRDEPGNLGQRALVSEVGEQALERRAEPAGRIREEFNRFAAPAGDDLLALAELRPRRA